MFGMSRMWLAVTRAIETIEDVVVKYTYEDYVKSLYPVAYWRLGEVNGVSQATNFTGQDGSKLDNRLWRVDQSDPDVNASDISIQSNSLLMEITSGTLSTVNSINAGSRNYLTGDFDIQIDISNFSSSSTSGSCYFWLVISDGTKSRWAAIRQYNGTTKQWATSVTGSNFYYTRTANYGRLRLVRTGSSLSSYYADGVGSFVLMKTESAFGASPVNVGMSIYDNSTAGAINSSANWDNLIITTDGWIPKYAIDEIGNYDGTYVNSPTVGVTGLVTDDSNTAVDFNGVDQRVDLGIVEKFTGDFTVSCLAKTPTSVTSRLVYHYDGTAVSGWFLTTGATSNKIRFITYGLSTNIDFTGNVDIGDNSTHLVLVKREGTLFSIYVDGVFDASIAISIEAFTGTTNPAQIAGDYNGAFLFTGIIDDVAFFNTALTQTEITNLYNLSKANHVDKPLYFDYAQDLNPIGYWRLGESSGTIAYDISGNNHHGDYVNSPTLGSTGLLVDDNDTSVTLNGSTQSITTDYLPPTGSNTRSFSFIIKTSTINATPQAILYYGDESSLERMMIQLTSTAFASGGGYLSIDINASRIEYSRLISDGNVHYVVVVINDSTLSNAQVFVDGVEQSEISSVLPNSTLNTGSTYNLFIGEKGSDSTFFLNGTIDEVKIFDYALTSQQIQDLYLLSEGVSITPASYYDTVRSLMPVSYWRLGESAGTTAVDEIGNHDGTYVNTPTLGATGLLTNDDDTSVTFNGTDEYITIGDYFNFDISDPFSVMFSIKLSALNKEHYIIGNRDSASIYQGWQVMMTGTNQFRILIDSTNVTVRYDSGITAQINTVYHISMTYDGSGNSSGMHIYINGADDVSGTYTGSGLTGSIVSAADTRIGVRDDLSATTFLQGTLDEPTLFNYVLTAQQAKDLYLLSEGVSLTPTSYNDVVRSLMPVSYWKLNETGSDTVAVDELGLYDGTYTNSPNLDSDSLVFGDGDTSATFTAASDQGVDLGLNLPINYGDSVSIIALLNVSSLNTSKCIMSRMDSSNVGWMLEFDSINTFRLLIRTTTTTNELDVKTRNEFVANKTYHLVFTLGGTTAADVSFYVDGIIQTNITSDDTWSSTPVYTSTDAYIGIRDYTSGLGMNGALDEVQFFDRVLNQVEITKLYNASKVMSLTLTIDSSLVDENLDDFPILVNLDATSGISDFDSTNIFDVYPNYVDSNFSTSKLMLRLTGTSGSTTFTDISTTPVSMTRGGNAQIGTAVADPFGEYDGYLYLDGNGDSIYTSATQGNINTGNFTFECWIRPDLGGNANGGVIGTSITSSYNERCAVGLGGTSSPYNLQCWNQAGSGTGKFFNITGVILEGVWTHIVLQRVSGQGMLFINGVLRATGDIANDIDSGIIRLGHIYTGSTNTYYKGCISDAQAHYVARYDSNFEVPTRRFATGTAELHENIKSMNFVYPTQHSRSSQKCKVEIDRWDSINKQAQLWVKVPYISKDDDTVLQLTADSKGEDNSNNIGATGDAAAQAVWTEYDAVYHLSADGTDSTVNGYDGTLNGINSANIVDFGIGKGMTFNGTDETILTPDLSLASNNEFTFEVTAHADTTARMSVYGFNDGTSSDPLAFLRLNETVAGTVFGLAAHTGEDQDVTHTGQTLNAYINFSHSSKEASDSRLTLNGVELTETTAGTGTYEQNATGLTNYIGASRTGASLFFDGKIKEFRVSKTYKTLGWEAANNESIDDTLITYTINLD